MTRTRVTIDHYGVHRWRLFNAMARELDGTTVEVDADALTERAYTRLETMGVAYRRRKGDCIGFEVRRPEG